MLVRNSPRAIPVAFRARTRSRQRTAGGSDQRLREAYEGTEAREFLCRALCHDRAIPARVVMGRTVSLRYKSEPAGYANPA